MTVNPNPDRRARYAAAIAEGFRAFDADTTADAYLDAELLDAVVAVADAEQAELLAAVSVVPPATNQTAPVDRAAVLREAADWFDSGGRSVQQLFGHQAAAELRRLAAEAPHTETPGGVLVCDGCGHLEHRANKCPATRYGERCACDEPAVAAQPGKENDRG